MSPRRFLIALAAAAILALGAGPAGAAQIVGGTIAPAKLTGSSTIVMFLHPF